jgi:phage baseplate assembly protein W
MPLPQVVRIDPRDLDKNRAVGVAIPFNAKGVFKSTYDTEDQIKSNLINLLLTYKGERIMNPEFGADLPRLIFEQITPETYKVIQDNIITNVNRFIPEIILTNIEINPDTDYNLLYINVSYQSKLSGKKDNLIIDFSTLQ